MSESIAEETVSNSHSLTGPMPHSTVSRAQAKIAILSDGATLSDFSVDGSSKNITNPILRY